MPALRSGFVFAGLAHEAEYHHGDEQDRAAYGDNDAGSELAQPFRGKSCVWPQQEDEILCNIHRIGTGEDGDARQLRVERFDQVDNGLHIPLRPHLYADLQLRIRFVQQGHDRLDKSFDRSWIGLLPLDLQDEDVDKGRDFDAVGEGKIMVGAEGEQQFMLISQFTHPLDAAHRILLFIGRCGRAVLEVVADDINLTGHIRQELLRLRDRFEDDHLSAVLDTP